MQVKIGNKSYECEKFGLVELADLQDWLQERREDKIIARAKKAFGDDLPDKIHDKVYDDISKEITLDDIDGAITSDVRSITYLIYLTVKKTNPGVTEDVIASGITGIDQAIDIIGKISPTGVKKKQSKRRKPQGGDS